MIEAERAARRGPRPGALSALQQRQRAASRGNILDAVRRLLVDRPFDAVAIEEVLAGAGVSRATFYRHFKSKDEVALALYEETFANALGHFEALAGVGSDAAAWVEALVAIYRANGPVSHLILLLGASDPRFHDRLRQDRHRLIDHLAPSIPAFARTQGSSEAALRMRTRADLLLLLLDRLCVEIAVHDALPHRRLYIEQVAAELAAFLQQQY